MRLYWKKRKQKKKIRFCLKDSPTDSSCRAETHQKAAKSVDCPRSAREAGSRPSRSNTVGSVSSASVRADSKPDSQSGQLKVAKPTGKQLKQILSEQSLVWLSSASSTLHSPLSSILSKIQSSKYFLILT